MENKKILINIADELQDATALVAFLQQITSLDGSMNEQSRNGMFLFVSEILDRLNKIQNSLSTLYVNESG